MPGSDEEILEVPVFRQGSEVMVEIPLLCLSANCKVRGLSERDSHLAQRYFLSYNYIDKTIQ